MQRSKGSGEDREETRNRAFLFGVILCLSLLAGLLTTWLASP